MMDIRQRSVVRVALSPGSPPRRCKLDLTPIRKSGVCLFLCGFNGHNLQGICAEGEPRDEAMVRVFDYYPDFE